jgi:hypothetical protein
MKITQTIIPVLAALLVVAGMVAAKTTTDYDRGANFSAYKTYSWAPSEYAPKDPLWNRRITDSIDRQLAAKGLTKVDGPADLILTFNGGLRETISLQGFGTGGRFLGGSFSVDQVTNVSGTLAVELYDGQSRQMVWRGLATETVSDNTDKNISKLEKDVEKLFKEYPPKPKK